MLKRTLIAAAAAAAFAATAAAPASAQSDVCVTPFPSAGEVCVLQEVDQAGSTLLQLLRDNDVCFSGGFPDRQFCIVDNTIG